MSTVQESMIFGSMIFSFLGSIAGAMVCGLCIGLPLAIKTHLDPLNCCMGAVLGGSTCGAFLGATAPFVIAKVREHQDKKHLAHIQEATTRLIEDNL